MSAHSVQSLLSLNELRGAARTGTPRADEHTCSFADRARVLTAHPPLPGEPVPHGDPGLGALLDDDELGRLAADGTWPENISCRVRGLLAAHSPSCANCDGRRCMGCVMRDPDHDCADDCPDCC